MKKFIDLLITFILFINILQINSYAETNNKTLAVSEFSNYTGINSFDNLQKGLADSLTNNLAKYKSFVILERSKLQEALKELSLNQTGLISSDSAVKLGKLVGSQYIIFGSVLKSGQLYQVSLRVVETETGKITLGESIECSSEEAIINSINYLSLKTASSLGETVDNALLESEKKKVESMTPPNNNFLFILGGVIVVIGIVAGTIATIEFWK